MTDRKCPKCGNDSVEVRRYKNGSRLYVHKKVKKAGPFPHFKITESCDISAADIKEGDK
jgi:hypothetical protein